jgi:hypothetical protein
MPSSLLMLKGTNAMWDVSRLLLLPMAGRATMLHGSQTTPDELMAGSGIMLHGPQNPP